MDRRILIKLSGFVLSAAVFSNLAFAQDKKKTIAIYAPGTLQEAFWKNVMDLSQISADQLGVNLQIGEAKDSRATMVRMITDAAKSGKVDGIIVQNFKDAGDKLTEIAQTYKIPIIIFDTPYYLPKGKVPVPQEKNPFWIAQITPDNVEAGYRLAEKLVKEAKGAGNTGVIEILALGGAQASASGEERIAGLNKYVAEHKADVKLNQLTYAEWKRDKASESIELLAKRYPNSKVFWCASDGMAYGVKDALTKAGKKVNKDYFTGGVDWINEAIVDFGKGEMTTTAGAHLFDGGFSVVAMFDYLNGVKMPEVNGKPKTLFLTPMMVLTKENYPKLKVIEEKKWASFVDYKQFSRFYNKDLKDYDFSVFKMIKGVEAPK